MEKNFEIRKAEAADLDRILELYALSREFMASHGNPRQWNTAWPPRALIEADIGLGRSFVVLLDGLIVGVFVYLQGVDIDPTYRRMEGGSWLDDSEYGVVHRLATDPEVSGVGTFALDRAFEQCHHLRVDTHGDNYVMQNLLEKLGFIRLGIIYVEEDNDPRLAYEKTPG